MGVHATRLGEADDAAEPVGFVGETAKEGIVDRQRGVVAGQPERIAAERQLGEDHQVGGLFPRPGDVVAHPARVARHVTEHRGDLHERHPYRPILHRRAA